MSNGYHNLESLVTFANIKDRIEVTFSNELKLSVSGPFAHAVPRDATNIVIKAAKFLSPEGTAHIRLTKNLPVQAGLGGGSADAAATLRSLSKLWKIPIPNYSETLGADVPVCLKSKPAIMKGIGEKITVKTMSNQLIGWFVGLDRDGALMLEVDGNIKIIHSGDVFLETKEREL